MKRILMPIIAVVFSLLSANAQEQPVEISAGHFKKISFGDNMKVVLKPIESEDAHLTLSKDASEKLSLNVSDGVLHISSRKALHNEVVYVLVSKVDMLTIGSNTNVDTDGVLEGKLEVFVNSGANARLKTRGKIKAHPLGDFDVTVSSTSILPNTSVSIR